MPSILRSGIFLILLAVLTLGWEPALAQADEAGTTDDAAKKVETLTGIAAAAQDGAKKAALDEDPEDSVSGSLDDSTGSIESAHDPLKSILYAGWKKSGDFRFGYVRSETEEPDGTKGTSSVWQARLHLGGSYDLNDWLIFNELDFNARQLELTAIYQVGTDGCTVFWETDNVDGDSWQFTFEQLR